MFDQATLGDALRLLDAWFDPAALVDDEPNGLVTLANPAALLRRVGFAVNASFEVIDDAARQSADLLLTHHGTGTRHHPELATKKRERLRAANIAHYVCHRPIDGATADALAGLLGIENLRGFADRGDRRFVGRHGSLPEPLSLNAFVARVSDTLHVAPYVLLGVPRVHQVGVITGAGGRTTWLEEARARGCDTFVTGEAGLHAKLYARETGLNLLLGTHTATERPGIEALARRLCAALPGVEALALRETPFE